MKTVVLGAGRMGRRHMQVVRDLGLDLVGICDQNPEALVLASKEQGVPLELHFDDVPTLLKCIRPECVIVATTAPSHAEYTCMAVEAGAKFILCEKPMAVSLAECDRMIEVCAHYGAQLAINHQMRFMEQYTEPKRIFQSDAFGGLQTMTVVAGNIGMAMNGLHNFEAFRLMTDEAPAEVTGWFSPEKVSNPRGPQYEDQGGSVRLVTASGKRFYMEIGADQGHGDYVIYAGRWGQLVVDELAGTMTLSVREEQYRNLPTTRYGMPAVHSIITILPADAVAPSRAVLDALLKGNGPPSGEDGRSAIATLIAAYISNENGHRTVELDETEEHRDRRFPWA